MCVISFTRRFIFVHVPKCGGSSVSLDLSALSRFPDLELGGTPFGEAIDEGFREKYGVRKHSTAAELEVAVGEDFWKSCFKFAMVRDPYTRTVSTFRYLRNWRGWPGSAAIDAITNVNDFVASPLWASEGPDRMFLSQTFYTGHGTKAALNATFRIENYPEGIVEWMRSMGQDYKPMPGHRNISQAIESKADITLSAESRARIASRYAADFSTYGYPVH